MRKSDASACVCVYFPPVMSDVILPVKKRHARINSRKFRTADGEFGSLWEPQKKCGECTKCWPKLFPNDIHIQNIISTAMYSELKQRACECLEPQSVCVCARYRFTVRAFSFYTMPDSDTNDDQISLSFLFFLLSKLLTFCFGVTPSWQNGNSAECHGGNKSLLFHNLFKSSQTGVINLPKWCTQV